MRDDLTVRRQLRRLILDRGVDLVHAHLSMSELLAAACVPRATPIVASRRGRTLGYEDRPLFRAWEALAHRRVRLMICNSEELARFTLSHDLGPPPITVISNGVDLERFARSPLPREPVVAVVANLNSYKRHDLFLRGFDLASRRIPAARAILVGDGPERRRLEKLAAELGIAERVTFLGRLADPRSAVSEARVVSLTSLHEGLPNALLEAMAMGRPVVATEVGGVPELVDDGVEGFLVGNDPVDLGERLAVLLTNDGTAETMGERARARAERFGWDDVIERTHEVYRRVLAGQRFPRGRVA